MAIHRRSAGQVVTYVLMLVPACITPSCGGNGPTSAQPQGDSGSPPSNGFVDAVVTAGSGGLCGAATTADWLSLGTASTTPTTLPTGAKLGDATSLCSAWFISGPPRRTLMM